MAILPLIVGTNGVSHRPRAERSRSAPIIERAPLPFIEGEGRDHIISYANSAFCSLVERTRSEVVGKSFAAIVHRGDECVPILDQVYRTGETVTHSLANDSDGDPAQWLYAMWPALGADELPAGVIIQMAKVTSSCRNATEVNEALLIAGLKQHELTEAAENFNAQLRAEISRARKPKRL